MLLPAVELPNEKRTDHDRKAGEVQALLDALVGYVAGLPPAPA